MAAACLLASLGPDVSIVPCVLVGGVQRSLVSVVLSASRHLRAADLACKGFCLVSEHRSSDP